MLAAVKHQEFEQMGKTRLACFFVFRAYLVPDVHCDYVRLVVFVYKKS